MPRPCAVEFHARGYKWSCATLPDATALRRGVSRSRLQIKLRHSPRCHGLAPWRLTFAATNKAAPLSQMPRPCAVEFHARGYTYRCATLPDATALRRGVSRSRLQIKLRHSPRCHGLAPWSFTLDAFGE